MEDKLEKAGVSNVDSEKGDGELREGDLEENKVFNLFELGLICSSNCS